MREPSRFRAGTEMWAQAFPSPSAGDLRELPRVPLRGEGVLETWCLKELGSLCPIALANLGFP